MFLYIFVNDQSTCFDIADPLMGAHDKVINIENALFILAKKQLAALCSINNQYDVIFIAKSCHWIKGKDSSSLASNLITEENRKLLHGKCILKSLNNNMRIFF